VPQQPPRALRQHTVDFAAKHLVDMRYVSRLDRTPPPSGISAAPRWRRAWVRSLGPPEGSLGSPALERPSEAQLMAVRIGNMEEALAPFRVARRRLDQVAGGDQSGI
jgi:hypothetical protein